MRPGGRRPECGRGNALESGPDLKADEMQGDEEGRTWDTRGHPHSLSVSFTKQGAQQPAVWKAAGSLVPGTSV